MKRDRDYVFVVCFLHTNRRYTFDLDIESTHVQPASCRATPVDDHLEKSMRIHGVGGREVARGFLRTLLNRAKISILCHQRGIEIFAVCFLYTSGQTFFFSQTPDRRPPHITGRHGNIVSLGWVGPLNKRAPFRVYDAVLGFIDQCLTRTRMADQGAGVS